MIAKREITDLDLLISIRGGLPEACDFCSQPYGEGRWPVPEEAGAWACNQCESKWDAADKLEKAK